MNGFVTYFAREVTMTLSLFDKPVYIITSNFILRQVVSFIKSFFRAFFSRIFWVRTELIQGDVLILVLFSQMEHAYLRHPRIW